MNKLNKKLVIVAVILAVLAAASGYIYLGSLNEPVTQSVGSPIIVAAVDIPEKTLITKSMLKTINVEYNPELRNLMNKEEDIVGRFTKERIFENDFFNNSKLVTNPELDVNLDLKKGHRAMSVALSAEEAVANLIYPGDYVDLVINLPEKKEEEVVVREKMSKFFLQNMYVLAVNMNTTEEEKVNGEKESKKSQGLVLTLSVPVEDVEMLNLAPKVGNLEAVLRAHGDDAIFEAGQATAEDLNLYSSQMKKSIFENEMFYITEEGDTLKKISKKFYGNENYYLMLKNQNGIVDEDFIAAGTKMRIPKL